MKKFLVLVLVLGALGLFAFYHFYIKERADFKSLKEIKAELIKLGATNTAEEGFDLFILEKGKCIINAGIYGTKVLDKMELKIFIKSPPVEAINGDEVRQEKAECLQFGVKTLITAFQSKKTKQELIKTSGTMFGEISKIGTFSAKFFDKKLEAKLEDGALIITIR